MLDAASRICNRYGVRVVPTTVWVDTAGVARAKQIGPLTAELVESYMAQFGG